MKQFNAKITSNKRITPDHCRLSFKAPKIAEKTKPGQFFNIRVRSSYKPLLRRPFSAHKIYKDRVEVLYKIVGEATRILSTKKKGDVLDIIGPLGNGFLPCRLAKSTCQVDLASRQGVILVGGGHGVAPLVALAKELLSAGSIISAFIGAKTEEHVVCDKELRKLGAKVHVATEDGSKGYKGLVTDLLKRKSRATSHEPRVTIYACGPRAMLKAVAKLAKQSRIPCRVSLEEYMACGIGTCVGCAVETKSGYKLVCKDGPVFWAKEIVWRT